MNILVTGATGFVGAWLVRRLMTEHEVFCLTRNSDILPQHARVHVIQQDLTVPLNQARLPGTMDVIVHLAQSRQFRKFPDQALDIFQVNTDSTLQLLEYGRRAGIKTFVLASSGGVCGYQPKPILETDPPEIINFYLASKYSAECLVKAYADYFSTVTLRYFFVYGEGQRNMFMPSLVERVLQGTPVVVAGKTGVSMNPVHVADAVEATARAIQIEGQETINVAGPEVTTVFDLAESIGRLTGKKPEYQFEPEKGPMAMVANIEKMKLKLGVMPKVSLQEGLGRLILDMTGKR
ncbi:MAG TPA: NAD(P)-dependent oxidoreductase [Nitrospiraceae bacterium]|jgi:nucleoside-diphosphate-sugar epimerase|nr:NAD(P)-dependent oxidoreductase [Nitrospiraceae bacterium]